MILLKTKVNIDFTQIKEKVNMPFHKLERLM